MKQLTLIALLSVATRPPRSSDHDAGAAELRRRAADLRTLNPNASPEGGAWRLPRPASGWRFPRTSLAVRLKRSGADDHCNVPRPAAREVQAGDCRYAQAQPQLSAARAFRWTQPGYPRDEAKYLPINSLVPAGSDRARSRCHADVICTDADLCDAVRPARLQRFVLRQSRRMRSNERHYLIRRGLA
jgi:hypothetical protein